ncbi:MAG: hypothetical protein ACUVXI_09300 [bacterium]
MERCTRSILILSISLLPLCTIQRISGDAGEVLNLKRRILELDQRRSELIAEEYTLADELSRLSDSIEEHKRRLGKVDNPLLRGRLEGLLQQSHILAERIEKLRGEIASLTSEILSLSRRGLEESSSGEPAAGELKSFFQKVIGELTPREKPLPEILPSDTKAELLAKAESIGEMARGVGEKILTKRETLRLLEGDKRSSEQIKRSLEAKDIEAVRDLIRDMNDKIAIISEEIERIDREIEKLEAEYSSLLQIQREFVEEARKRQ